MDLANPFALAVFRIERKLGEVVLDQLLEERISICLGSYIAEVPDLAANIGILALALEVWEVLPDMKFTCQWNIIEVAIATHPIAFTGTAIEIIGIEVIPYLSEIFEFLSHICGQIKLPTDGSRKSSRPYFSLNVPCG